jgi:hypothetical protein
LIKPPLSGHWFYSRTLARCRERLPGPLRELVGVVIEPVRQPPVRCQRPLAVLKGENIVGLAVITLGPHMRSRRGWTSSHSRRCVRPVKLWPFNSKPNTIFARLETAYLSGLDAVDKIEERKRSSAASGRFTAEGVKDDALKFAMGDLVPSFHRARTTIKKARAEVAERKSRLKVEGPDRSDVAGAFRRMEIRTFLREMKGNMLNG